MELADRPPLRISAQLRCREGVNILARFAIAGLYRRAWDLWRALVVEKHAVMNLTSDSVL